MTFFSEMPAIIVAPFAGAVVDKYSKNRKEVRHYYVSLSFLITWEGDDVDGFDLCSEHDVDMDSHMGQLTANISPLLCQRHCIGTSPF